MRYKRINFIKRITPISNKPEVIDSDGDGLTDEEERILGTDPYSADSDNDGLSDYEEVMVYGTDALDSDTDKDGMTDGEEVRQGRNPLGAGTLRDYFISHEGNNYIPHLLHPKRLAFYGIFAIIMKVILVAFLVSLPVTAWLTPEILLEQSKKIVELTNDVRKKLNLTLLKESSSLSQSAYKKAEDMLLRQYFAHIGPDNKKLTDWLKIVGYSYEVAGENLAMGFANAEEVVNAWTRSKTHYDNMIDPDFTEIGVGMASGLYSDYETTLVAQYFGKPRGLDNRPSSAKATAGAQQITDNREKKVVSQVIAPIAKNSPTPKSPRLAGAGTPEGNNSKTTLNMNNTEFKVPSGVPAPASRGDLGVGNTSNPQEQDKKVEGEKKTAALPPLVAPRLIKPVERLLALKEKELEIEIFAPQAEKVSLESSGQLLITKVKALTEDYIKFPLSLTEGNYKLKAVAQRGTEKAFSDEQVLVIDNTSPQLDNNRTELIVDRPEGKNERLVKAIVYLSPDTESARVDFSNYHLELNKDAQDLNRWSGELIIFNEENEQIFNPVVLASITAKDYAGNVSTVDLSWKNITPVKTSLMSQYFFLKGHQSNKVKLLFDISSYYYRILLVLASLVLAGNLIWDLKKQKGHVIASTLGLMGLLVVLIII